MDDRELVEAVRAGDAQAFQDLVERETASVFRACYRTLGRIHDAEDATQEAFVIAYRSIGTFRGDGSLSAWLARIATRQALRRATRRRDVAWLDPAAPGGLDVAGPSEPLADLERAERHRQVRSAVANLPEPYREVVALRFFAELSLAQIAAATGRPLGTVKTHLHRGLARLRERLDGEAA